MCSWCLYKMRKDTNHHSLGNQSLCSRPYYVEVAAIIAIMLIQFRKTECSTEVPFLRAAACTLRTMQACQEHRGETSLMFTLTCHASFLLLCRCHVCQVLFRHNVAIHCTLNRQTTVARSEVSVKSLRVGRFRRKNREIQTRHADVGCTYCMCV